MASRVDLPDGGWADIKDPAELTNRDRKLLGRYARPARAALASRLRDQGIKPAGFDVKSLDPETNERLEESLTADDSDLLSDAQAAFIVAYVTAWSLDRPLPTMDTVDDLPALIFDALALASSALGEGVPDFGPDGAVDPASPTGPSGASVSL